MSAGGEVVCGLAWGDGLQDGSQCPHNPAKVLSASWRIRRFIMEKAFSFGLKSGLSGVLDGLAQRVHLTQNRHVQLV